MGSKNIVLFVFFLLGFCCMAAARVVLIGSNVTLSFDDIEANFAPAIKGSGECGVLYLAEPLDACTELTNKTEQLSNVSSPFVLMVRGRCSFEEKVRRAQDAGFKAAIVYDNEDDGVLVTMAGDSAGIIIHAVFVLKASGEILKKYAGLTNVELWLVPSFENSAWSIMAISFISLLAMSAVLATCFFIRRHRIRRERPQASRVCEFHGMSSRLVKAMPSLIFTSVVEDNCTSRTCAICLEDYSIGEKLRILPCCHKFHAICVDSWLTLWRTFCPVCKCDARTGLTGPPPSESTPLLSLSPASVASSQLSSVRSSLASSSAIQIIRATLQSPSVSRSHSLANTPYIQPSLRSYHQSPSLRLCLVWERERKRKEKSRKEKKRKEEKYFFSLPFPSLPFRLFMERTCTVHVLWVPRILSPFLLLNQTKMSHYHNTVCVLFFSFPSFQTEPKCQPKLSRP